MSNSQQRRTSLWFACVVFIVLMAAAHGGAELISLRDSHNAEPGMVGQRAASVIHYRSLLTIWATILLLAPALCLHVFSHSDRPNYYWRAFWTFGYFGYLAHVYWTVFGEFNGDLARMWGAPAFASHAGWFDFFLTGWWGVDVVLAWLLPNWKWVRVQRAVVHLV